MGPLRRQSKDLHMCDRALLNESFVISLCIPRATRPRYTRLRVGAPVRRDFKFVFFFALKIPQKRQGGCALNDACQKKDLPVRGRQRLTEQVAAPGSRVCTRTL